MISPAGNEDENNEQEIDEEDGEQQQDSLQQHNETNNSTNVQPNNNNNIPTTTTTTTHTTTQHALKLLRSINKSKNTCKHFANELSCWLTNRERSIAGEYEAPVTQHCLRTINDIHVTSAIFVQKLDEILPLVKESTCQPDDEDTKISRINLFINHRLPIIIQDLTELLRHPWTVALGCAAIAVTLKSFAWWISLRDPLKHAPFAVQWAVSGSIALPEYLPLMKAMNSGVSLALLTACIDVGDVALRTLQQYTLGKSFSIIDGLTPLFLALIVTWLGYMHHRVKKNKAYEKLGVAGADAERLKDVQAVIVEGGPIDFPNQLASLKLDLLCLRAALQVSSPSTQPLYDCTTALDAFQFALVDFREAILPVLDSLQDRIQRGAPVRTWRQLFALAALGGLILIVLVIIDLTGNFWALPIALVYVAVLAKVNAWFVGTTKLMQGKPLPVLWLVAWSLAFFTEYPCLIQAMQIADDRNMNLGQMLALMQALDATFRLIKIKWAAVQRIAWFDYTATFGLVACVTLQATVNGLTGRNAW